MVKDIKMCIYVEANHRSNSSIIASLQGNKSGNQRQIAKKCKR